MAERRPNLTKEAIAAGASAGHDAALDHIENPLQLHHMAKENQEQALKVAEATIRAALDVMFAKD